MTRKNLYIKVRCPSYRTQNIVEKWDGCVKKGFFSGKGCLAWGFRYWKVTFPQAWAYCKNAGMEFISLPSAAQNDALGKALEALGSPTTSFYIGGIYLRNGFLAKWYWVDGQEDFNYANWASTPSPSASIDNCVIFNYSATTKKGTWGYGSCTLARYFICQI